ncbi:MAG: histidine--tRNA ligase [Candidatus Thermoplasmatota archaeon]|nr:histidine--tRNA ligase [Candidatus Thermoplasmatota archaeon]
MMERPRGTRDFLPEEMAKRRGIEDAMRSTALGFGYGEVGTPTFEHTDLFVARSGEAIVNDMYAFEDKGGRSLSLRPELTAAVMRLYAEKLTHSPKPVRVFYTGPCFRYERPQKGRYREFYQFGAELIGSPHPEGDAEIIALAIRAVEAAGVKGPEVRVGHVGALHALMDAIGVEATVASQAFPMIDKGDMASLQTLFDEQEVGYTNFELVADFIGISGDRSVIDSVMAGYGHYDALADALSRLSQALEYLDMYEELEYTVDLGIARGLDYYTGVVFEVDWEGLGAEKQICGGGAYELGQIFGLDNVPATGFAIGLDRVSLAVGMTSGDEADRSGALVVPMDRKGAVMDLAMRAVETLRGSGVRAELEVMRRGTGKALKVADQRGLRWAVIVGTDEAAQDKVTLKDMVSGEQRLMTLDELARL